MVSVETLNQCFADFCNGKSLAKIAEERGLCKRTLERYSAKDHWVIRRQRTWDEAKQQIVQEVAGTIRANDPLLSGQLWRLMAETIAEQRAYLNGRIPKKQVRGGTRQLIAIAKALYHCNFAERLNFINGEAVLTKADGSKLSI